MYDDFTRLTININRLTRNTGIFACGSKDKIALAVDLAADAGALAVFKWFWSSKTALMLFWLSLVFSSMALVAISCVRLPWFLKLPAWLIR